MRRLQLLDDNREVYVAETDTTVKADASFRIFATQNPVGAYAGRKRLSRAFLNRFVVLNVQQPPDIELNTIVCERCQIPRSTAAVMIDVMSTLKRLRLTTRLFGDTFMTLRDLFRWANRCNDIPANNDWRQVVAEQGYLLLGSRCRSAADALKIGEIISHFTQRKIDVDALYALDSRYFPQSVRDAYTRERNAADEAEPNERIVFTRSMRRMIVQCAQAFASNEPVLLVGETGCGKTSVVYLLADVSED